MKAFDNLTMITLLLTNRLTKEHSMLAEILLYCWSPVWPFWIQ